MRVKVLFSKYKSFFVYAFFGICTTSVNLLSYKFFYFVLGISNVSSAIIAWFLAILFAFFTNKLWVFGSKSFAIATFLPELLKFFICRIATGALDVGIMWFAVDKMQWNAMLWKLICDIFVIVFNYIASKLVIFVVKREKRK